MREQVEATLRERMRVEESLRRMTDVPGVGILTFEIATGVLLEANDAFLTMSGYTRAQIERGALTWRSMTPPEHIASSETQWLRLTETGRLGPYEKELFRANGSRSTMLSGASVGGGRVVEYCVAVAERTAAH